jgi:hypothetical protein
MKRKRNDANDKTTATTTTIIARNTRARPKNTHSRRFVSNASAPVASPYRKDTITIEEDLKTVKRNVGTHASPQLIILNLKTHKNDDAREYRCSRQLR